MRNGPGSAVPRRRDAFERSARGLPLGAIRRDLDHPLPGRLGTREILPAERQHNPLVQHRLRMDGIERQ